MSTVIGGDIEDVTGSGETTYDGLYVVDDLTMPDGMDVPDIFSSDPHHIEDTPEATAEFESFVNELDFAPSVAEPGIPFNDLLYSPVGLSTSSSSPRPIVNIGSAPILSQFIGSPSSSTVITTSNAAPTSEEEYPDRLDLRSLGPPHALPLNVAADATLHVAEATSTNSMQFSSSILAEPDALAAHLALPLSARSWTTPNISPSSNRSHELMMNARVAGASSRGRPRVREMKHLPERNSPTCAPSAPVQISSSVAPSAAKLRYSKGAAPSKYCHVCGRSAKTVSVALCGNNRLGLCRKVVCDKCLLMHQRDSWDLAKSAGAGWICMHCRNRCPERARCHQYQRNNLKRRMRASSSPVAASSVDKPSNGRVLKPHRKSTTVAAAVAAASATLSASTLAMYPDGRTSIDPNLFSPSSHPFNPTHKPGPLSGIETSKKNGDLILDTSCNILGDLYANSVDRITPMEFKQQVEPIHIKAEGEGLPVDLFSTPAKELDSGKKTSEVSDGGGKGSISYCITGVEERKEWKEEAGIASDSSSVNAMKRESGRNGNREDEKKIKADKN